MVSRLNAYSLHIIVCGSKQNETKTEFLLVFDSGAGALMMKEDIILQRRMSRDSVLHSKNHVFNEWGYCLGFNPLTKLMMRWCSKILVAVLSPNASFYVPVITFNRKQFTVLARSDLSLLRRPKPTGSVASAATSTWSLSAVHQYTARCAHRITQVKSSMSGN